LEKAKGEFGQGAANERPIVIRVDHPIVMEVPEVDISRLRVYAIVDISPKGTQGQTAFNDTRIPTDVRYIAREDGGCACRQFHYIPVERHIEGARPVQAMAVFEDIAAQDKLEPFILDITGRFSSFVLTPVV